MEPEIADLETFAAEVARELLALQRRLPNWFPPGPYADDRWPLDPLDRREAERLKRLGPIERGPWRERTRERVARERKNPWDEQDRWGLRKRVWSERRASERVLLERRERALLERADELSAHAAQAIDWLRELCELEPAAQPWCDKLMQHIEGGDVTIAELDALWRRRRRALERRAQALLPTVCMVLGPELVERDLDALARAIVAQLVADGAAIPRIPALHAMIAIKIDQIRRTGHWAEGDL